MATPTLWQCRLCGNTCACVCRWRALMATQQFGRQHWCKSSQVSGVLGASASSRSTPEPTPAHILQHVDPHRALLKMYLAARDVSGRDVKQLHALNVGVSAGAFLHSGLCCQGLMPCWQWPMSTCGRCCTGAAAVAVLLVMLRCWSHITCRSTCAARRWPPQQLQNPDATTVWVVLHAGTATAT